MRTTSSSVTAAITMLCSAGWTAAFCQTADTGVSGQPNKLYTARSPLKLLIKTDKSTYRVGEPVSIFLTLKNPTREPVPVTYASGQKFDLFIVRTAENKKPSEMVWQYSVGMMFTQMVTTVTIAPGKSIQYAVKYPSDEITKPIPLTKGAYLIKGTVTCMGTGSKPEAVTKVKVK